MNEVTPQQIRDLYRHHFPSFVRFVFNELHPHNPFKANWHIDVMADALARCANQETRQLVINLPPRYLKSLCASVALPAWLLGRHPERKMLLITGSRALSAQLSNQVRALLQSERYQALFPVAKTFEIDRSVFSPHGGQFIALTTKQALEGLGADYIIIDDPMTMQDMDNVKANQALHQWYDRHIYQRLNDKSQGVVILVMQRLHPQDLTAHLLSHKTELTHLSLPAVAASDEQFELSDGRVFTRSKGEALNPAIESLEDLRETLDHIGGSAFMAQYQQSPIKSRGYQTVWTRRITESNPEPGLTVGFIKISDRDIARYEAFGDEIIGWPPKRRQELSPEEWKEVIQRRQAGRRR